MRDTMKIRKLNDSFRSLILIGGVLVITNGINELGPEHVVRILESVRTHSHFPEEDDPFGEHDFGAFDYEGHRIFWKIDYYDPKMEYGSEDPADPAKTLRVLTVLLAKEY